MTLAHTLISPVSRRWISEAGVKSVLGSVSSGVVHHAGRPCWSSRPSTSSADLQLCARERRRARAPRPLVAGGELPLGRADLPARQPAAARAARPEHIKPRLLGHWGTTPGLNFVYAHMNRAIRRHELDALFVTGPGHGGPGIVANTYLEGTYSETYPHVSQDEDGLRRLFRQFSFPGGIPSHVAPETPGSIHEGGELGYSLLHAYGAALDNPDLLVCCVVGDGEAETGPLATSWHSNKFLDPISDGAVLPILHLNGYKIANPTVLARIPERSCSRCSRATGTRRVW